MKISHIAEDFYCRNCGSTTAMKIGNLNKVRCMGCDLFYKTSLPFTPTLSPIDALKPHPRTPK
uniref:Uncharacterized protein n=1 Tax=viral metagenome TaxID=1070528 RepID=A0A6M3KYS4_9ZZZZ